MTISFNGLGNEGRLGNQMFQYAFLRGVADNINSDWIIPPEDALRYDNYGLYDCFVLKNCEEKNRGESNFNDHMYIVRCILMRVYLIGIKVM